MVKSRYFVVALFVLVWGACNNAPKEVTSIDVQEVSDNTDVDTLAYKPLKVAVSAILSPRETFHSYEDMFRYITAKTGIPIEFHQRRTYEEINQMLVDGKLDFAFICSGAYTELDNEEEVHLLVAPVSGGNKFYKSYIITHKNHPADRFDDLRGASFAFTDPMSNSGALYVNYRLHNMGEDAERFFGSTMYTYGHDLSVQMVAKGIVDAASVSNLVYDHFKAMDPERVENLKIIETSDEFGMPPVVVSAQMDEELQEKLYELFTQMHLDPAANNLMDSLLIDSFIEGEDKYYATIREMRREVDVEPTEEATDE